MTGWLNLPEEYDKDEFARIQKAAAKIQSDSEVLIVIGIGGSYLGARAAIDFLNNSFVNLQRRKNARHLRSSMLETLSLQAIWLIW